MIISASRAGPLAAEALAAAGAPPAVRGAAAGGGPACGQTSLAPVVRGTVLSVHQRAVNLILEDGPLVALLPKSSPIHPWALSLPLDPSALREGMAAEARGDRLLVGPLQISLKGMKVEDLRLHARPRTVAAPAGATAATAGLTAAAQSSAGLIPSPPEDALADILDRFRRSRDPYPLEALIGLGEGLTPSGDDALVGLLAGLDFSRDVRPDALPLRERLVGILAGPLEQRTTRLSAQMLRAAADGLYAEPILRFLQALDPAAAAAPAPLLAEAAADLLALGHTSGAAALRGIAAAISGYA